MFIKTLAFSCMFFSYSAVGKLVFNLRAEKKNNFYSLVFDR